MSDELEFAIRMRMRRADQAAEGWASAAAKAIPGPSSLQDRLGAIFYEVAANGLDRPAILGRDNNVVHLSWSLAEEGEDSEDCVRIIVEDHLNRYTFAVKCDKEMNHQVYHSGSIPRLVNMVRWHMEGALNPSDLIVRYEDAIDRIEALITKSETLQ